METMRPMSILPAIKCSDCGAEIEISSMGEHVCVPRTEQAEAPMPPATPSSPASPVVGQGPLSPVRQRLRSQEPPRPVRAAPPRIDPSVANKSYVQKGLLSPGGSTVSSGRSPLTPQTGGRALHSPMMRSATSPAPRGIRPPSLALSSNMDCAFPPFPTTARSSSAPRPRSPAQPPARLDTTDSDMAFAPRSPYTSGGANVMQRMNAIAPGPFNARAASRTPPLSRQITPAEDAGSDAVAAETSAVPAQPQAATGPLPQRRQASAPAQTAAKVSSPGLTNRDGRPVPQRPVRPEPLDGFLAMLKSEAEGASQQPSPALRANTFPLANTAPEPPKESNDLSRRPSEPNLRPRRPTLTASANSAPGHIPFSADLQFPLPPMPALPSAPAPQPQPHTVHAASDSASSTSSTHSFRSDLSPPVSASSSVSMLSATLGDLPKDTDSSLTVPSLQIKPKAANSRPSPDFANKPIGTLSDRREPLGRIDEKLHTSLNVAQPLSSTAEKQRVFPLMSPHIESPESPVMPTFLPRHPQSHTESSSSTPMASPPSEHGFPPPGAPRKGSSPMPGKRPGTSSKHVCRGCNEPITGKSVKAADGRLTGRYHKHCFVCRMCSSPFQTADFYVIDNNPYCEHHYHELNNSLCAHCDRGIEGPYLETQQNQKFHPSCFTCLDCHKILSDDYFEIAGKVYCEQHAFTALRRQEGLGPKRNMERRTTRFMMM